MRDFKPSKEFQNNCVLPPNNPSIKLLQSNKREKIDESIGHRSKSRTDSPNSVPFHNPR